MTYATLAKAQGMMTTYTVGASSSVTTTQAEQMLADISDEIDTVLNGAGLSTPVTTPTSFVNRLALLNCYGVIAMILKSAYPEQGGAGSNPAYAFWETRYQAGLKSLRSGDDIPTSTEIDSPGRLEPSSYFTRNPEEEEELGNLEGASLFKIDRTF